MARKLALVIGNSSYDDPGLAPLKAAEVDVRELAGVLRTPQIGEFEEVLELANEGLAVVRRSVARFFGQARRDDLLLCYFSGHGIKDENGHLYLAVKDTDPQLLAGTSIEADFITGQMDRSRSKRQVLILDCCYSGAFADGAKGGGSDVVGTAPAFEGTGYGRVVLTATDSLQNAWQGDEVIGSEASVFTHYLLEGLRTGDADRDGDGLITTDELHEYIHEHVIKETSKQTPRRWNYKMEGDIIVARNPHPEAHAAELPLEVRALIESPLVRLRAEAITELAGLVNGRHRGLALAARRALADLRSDDSRRVASAAEAVLGTLPPLEKSIDTTPGDAERLRKEAEHLAAEATRKLQVAAARNRIEDLLQRDELDQAEQALGQAEQESGDPTAFADLRRSLADKQLDRRVGDVVAGARQDFAAGRHDQALSALDQFLPAHPLVASTRAELRRGLVTEQLRLARGAFERGDYDSALQYGERAAVVEPDNAVAHELINKSRVAIEAKPVLALLQEATGLLSSGRIEEALSRAEAAAAGVPDLFEADDLRTQVQAVLDRVLGAREREARIHTSLERAQQSFDRGEYETALRRVYEVLALDPDRPPARELEQRAQVQLQAQREQERARLDALDRVNAARALAEAGRLDEADAALHAIAPPTDTVRAAVAEAMAVVARLHRRARAEAAVADARAAAAAGDFTHAVSIIEAIPADDLTEDGRQVRADGLASLELARTRQRLEQLLASADALIDAGDVTQARARLVDAAALGLDDHRLDRLQHRLEELVTRVEGQQRQQALDREAAAVVQKANRRFADNPQAGVALLERSGLAHPDVVAALDDLRGKLAHIEEQAKQERERHAEETRRAAAAEAARLVDKQRRAEQERQEREARQRERAASEEKRKELEASQLEQQRISAEEKRQAEAARERDEQIQPPVVEPATPTAPAPVQAPVSPLLTQRRGKALVAAAVLVVVAMGSWVALSLRNGDAPGVTNSTQPVTPAESRSEGSNEPIGTTATAGPEPQLPDSPPPAVQQPPGASRNEVAAQTRQQLAIADARKAIQAAIDRGDLALIERLLSAAQLQFGAENFRTESEARNRLRVARTEEVRASVRDLVAKSQKERDNQAAIGLLKRALQLSPGDPSVQAELRRRNEALTAEARQKELDERERQAENQRQRQQQDRDEAIKNAQTAIDRALASGDLDGADSLMQDAERRYGAALFGPQRQQLTLKRDRAGAAAGSERVKLQIRAVLDRFARAYSAKDEAGLAAAWPSIPRAFYQRPFSDFPSLSWVFGTCDIEVAGAAATASCPVTLARVDIRGRRTSESGKRRFTLSNQGGAWRIEGMQVQ